MLDFLTFTLIFDMVYLKNIKIIFSQTNVQFFMLCGRHEFHTYKNTFSQGNSQEFYPTVYEYFVRHEKNNAVYH